MARPGGNITGIVVLRGELDGKRLELLRELVPGAARMAYLAYPRLSRSVARTAAIEALARPRGLRVTARPVSDTEELEAAFAAGAADHDQAILVEAGAVMVENRSRCSRSQRNTDCLPFTSGGSSLKAAVCCPTDRCTERISNAPPPCSTRS